MTVLGLVKYLYLYSIIECADCCSGNGRCVGGRCQCKSGFEENDCGAFKFMSQCVGYMILFMANCHGMLYVYKEIIMWNVGMA